MDGKDVDRFPTRSWVGEIGMALNEKRGAGLKALTDTELLELKWADLCVIGLQCPSFIFNFCKTFAADSDPNSVRIRLATRKMLMICSGDVHPSFMRTDDPFSAEEIKSRQEHTDKYQESILEYSDELKKIEVGKMFPPCSRMRDAIMIQTMLTKAQEIAADPVSSAIEGKDIGKRDLTHLKNVPWLRSVPNAVIAEIVARSCVTTFSQAGSAILNGEDSCKSIYLVCSGNVRVHLASTERIETRAIREGFCFGLAGFAPETRYSIKEIPVICITVLKEC
jgi:hypothetical protein